MNIIMLKDLPIQNVLTLTQENTLLDAVTALVENNMESVVITNSDYKSFTYLSLTNILNSMAEESWKDIKISRIKTKPLKTIEQDATTIKALLLMDDDEIIGVVDKKENLCGVSSSRDIIFAINYPKEKMSSIPIEDIIPGNNFATADYNDNLQDALYKINTSQTKCLIVHKNDKPYGIITQRDLINILYKNGNLSEEVEKHMNMPLLTIKKEASIVTVFNMMQMYNLQRVTLLSDHGHCVGVITQKMILNTYHKHIIKEECLAILASNESLSKELVKHTTETHKSQNELQTCTEELPTIKSTLKDYSQLENMSLVNVSHEIKTPLNAIMGYMELLSFTSLDKKQSSYINKTSNSIDYLLHLLNHILDFNKIETGQVNISYAPFDIHALFSDCIDLFQMEAKKKNLLLEYEIETYVPQYFYGDSYRIRQVVINILSNAIKFTEEGSIFLNVIANENENSTYNVEFVISDTGIGISKQNHQDIFQQFTQIENRYISKNEGTGLGLSISKGLMEAMGGTIEIDSELDNGSTFSCTLNLEVVQNGFTVEEPLRENIYFKNCNVLLVEDNEDSQEVARELLQKAGAEVDVAFNGKIALQMIQDKAYDLVLMDIQMQIMGGFSSTHKFRKNGFTDLPIIALSASESNLQRKRSIKAGMNDYISKPITYKKLQNILNTWCEDKKTCLPSTLKRDSICWANQIKHMPGLVLDNELCEYWLNKESFLHNLNLFISKLPLEVQSLHKLLNEGKVNDALQLIHRLKGSVKLYKALRLFESLKACERQLQKVGTADSSLLSELDAAVKQILE